jgi:hypothetical protein
MDILHFTFAQDPKGDLLVTLLIDPLFDDNYSGYVNHFLKIQHNFNGGGPFIIRANLIVSTEQLKMEKWVTLMHENINSITDRGRRTKHPSFNALS